MSKYLITGGPGAGKTSVIEALQRRGYIACDTDSTAGATLLEDRHAGRPVDKWPPEPIDWSRYTYNWQRTKINELLASASTVFLGAIVSNQSEFYSLFDHIFVLTLDTDSVRERILTRTNHNYGKHPDELKGLLHFHPHRQTELLAAPRAIAVNANQPLAAVVDEILSHIQPNEPTA